MAETVNELHNGALFRAGDKCPCRDCDGIMVQEDTQCGFDHIICPECGYCPEDEFDGRIKDCPACSSWSYIINQENIVCSGCDLELTAEDEEAALKAWNAMSRRSWVADWLLTAAAFLGICVIVAEVVERHQLDQCIAERRSVCYLEGEAWRMTYRLEPRP